MKNSMTSYSQKLRNYMTKEEKHLWYDYLKILPVTVKRQAVIDYYIVDFYIPQAKIVIELDGSQHFTEDGALQDGIRDHVLHKYGIRVLRYSNREIHENFDGVCKDIQMYIDRVVTN